MDNRENRAKPTTNLLAAQPRQELAQALETMTPAQVASQLAASPLELAASLAWKALGPEQSPRLGLIHANPTEPRLRQALSESAWQPLFPCSDLKSRLPLEAGLLMIFDFWDQSHQAAQRADDLGEHAFSAYWHGIAHRREPDPGNAAYWFRKVGRHPLFHHLAQAAKPLLDSHPDPNPRHQLARNGWDPFAMIDLCTSANPGTPAELLARQLERLEMATLLAATLDQLS